MEPRDILFYTLSLAVLVFVGFFSYWGVIVIKILRSTKRMLDTIEETVEDWQIIKEGVRVGLLKLLGNVLGKPKGGDNSGKEK